MNDPMLAKVRKLLDKAEDPAATAEESEIYTAKAAELIADYGIDQALLARSDPTRDSIGDRVVDVEPPYAQDKADLLGSVAGRLRCRAVQRRSWAGGRKHLTLHLFGFESDLTRAEVLYTSLLLQATTGVTRARAPRGEQLAAFRRSWLRGFTHAVMIRLAEAEERARTEAEEGRSATHGSDSGSDTSVALVLADRSAAVDEVLHEAYPHVRPAPSRRLSGSGGAAGWAAGQRADIGGDAAGLGGARQQSLPQR